MKNILTTFIFILQICYVASTMALQTPLQTTEKFTLMDFETQVLHDKPWFLSQPKGSTEMFVQDKGDSGVDKLSLAVGEGRNGSNALLVESTTASMGLPGFWIIKAKTEGYVKRPTDSTGYLLPSGKRANRLEFWLRFEDGFRKNKSSVTPPRYPNHQNLHVGMYQFNPAKMDGKTAVVESDNWHFYHQVYLRHDKAGDNWIHVVVNQQPQHQRSINGSLPNNPTKPHGNYFEILTRLYIDLHPYFSDPEKPYPVKMWVDDIALSYVPEVPDLDIKFAGYTDTVRVVRGVTKAFKVTIKNKSAIQACGKLSVNMPYWYKPTLTDNNTVINSKYCLDGNTTQNLTFSITPKTSRRIGEKSFVSLTFINNNSIFSDSLSTNRSITDSNVEKRWYPETGPHDGIVSSDFLRIIIADTETVPVIPPVVVEPPVIIIDPVEPPIIVLITKQEVQTYLQIQEKILFHLLGFVK